MPGESQERMSKNPGRGYLEITGRIKGGQSRGLGMNLSPKHGEGGFSNAVSHRLSEQEEAKLLTRLLEF